MKYAKRKKLFVDPKVQGALLKRAVIYWVLFVVATMQIVLSWQIARGPDGPFFSHFDLGKLWAEHSDVAIAALLMLPILLLDTIFVSNRIVGPINRTRQALRKMAAGETVPPIKFRKNDYYAPMADEINAAAARLACLEQQVARQSRVEPQADDEPALAR